MQGTYIFHVTTSQRLLVRVLDPNRHPGVDGQVIGRWYHDDVPEGIDAPIPDLSRLTPISEEEFDELRAGLDLNPWQ